MASGGQLVSGAAAKGSGRRSPRSLARTTSIPYWMKRTRFFIPVTMMLLSRTKAAALQSARCVPPSLRAAAKLRMGTLSSRPMRQVPALEEHPTRAPDTHGRKPALFQSSAQS